MAAQPCIPNYFPREREYLGDAHHACAMRLKSVGEMPNPQKGER